MTTRTAHTIASATRTSSSTPFIVGIHAGNADVVQVVRLLGSKNHSDRVAYVIVASTPPDALPELHARAQQVSDLPWRVPAEGTPIEAGTAYLLSAASPLRVAEGCFVAPEIEAGTHETPGGVLLSLASEQRDRMVCVALDGASAGELRALQEIKKHGGIVIVEEAPMPSDESLSRQAAREGVADHISSIERIPNLVLRHTGATALERLASSAFLPEAAVVRLLHEQILPPLLVNRRPNLPLRIWVAGCATGEPAYGLAVAALTAVRDTGASGVVKVFGTDSHPTSLNAAREGIYGSEAVAALPPSFNELFFSIHGTAATVRPALRNAVTFAQHNLLTESMPFAGLDVIYCPHVLKYVQGEARDILVAALAGALAPEGVLIVDSSGADVSALGPLVSVERGLPIFRHRLDASPATAERQRTGSSTPSAPGAADSLIQQLWRHDRETLFDVLEELPILVYLLKEDHSLPFTNSSFRQTFGEPGGRKCYEVFKERSAPCDDCTSCDPTCLTGTRVREWTASNGSTYLVQGTSLENDGKAAVSLQLAFDLSQRSAPPASLLHNERFIQKVADTAPFLIYVYDLAQQRHVYVNSQAETLLGYSAEELTSYSTRQLRSLVHPKDLPLYEHHLRCEFSQENSERPELEFRLRHADGEWRWLRVREVVLACDDAGRPVEVLGTARDVTERKEVEAALEETEQRLQALFRDAEIGIAILDEEGVPVQSNRTLQELLDYAAEELTRKPLMELAHPNEGRRDRRLLDDVLAGELQCFETESRYFRRTGDVVWCHLTVWPLHAAQDERRLAVAVVQDITDRRRAEEDRHKFEVQIQQTQKLESLGVMAGGIAHDFNNLLMGILGNTSLILDEPALDHGLQVQIKEVTKAAEHAAELCKQLLAYAGKSVFALKPMQLSALVEDMRHLLAVSVKRRAQLDFKLAPDLPPIKGDATQIRQILMNLVINAAEAMEEGIGAIKLSTGVQQCSAKYLNDTFLNATVPPGEFVYVQVADPGHGMDNNTMARIFDPFFTTKFTGRGLGLAAVVGIVNAHDGAIKVESQLGKGTVFRVLFPAARNTTLEPVRIQQERPRSQLKGTILVIDDEEMVRNVAEKMLLRVGLQVMLAEDGVIGLDLFRRNADTVDAVLLDLTMPRMNGEQVFYELRRIRPDVPIIISSGYDEQEALDRVGSDGTAGFIQKPYQLNLLIEKLRAVIQT
jgi:PAS domain S-box-containing protein